MFPPKTRADVGMVQCVSEGHGKPPGGKPVRTRRRAGPCKEEASLSPKTRADVGMVQCVSEGHGKPPGGKPVRTRRRAGPCKEEASLSTQSPNH